jgi:hypothetical protein
MNELRSSNVNIPIYDLIYIESDSTSFGGTYVPTLKPKYTFIGLVNLNFYQILSENDNRILKQSSQFFQSFSPLYPNQSKGIQFQVFDDLYQEFEEDILFNGNPIGKMNGTLYIKKIPLIRQILCGVHTENGFEISSVFLSNKYLPGNTDTTPSEIKKLIIDINSILETYNKANFSLKVNIQTTSEFNLKNLYTFRDIKSTLEKSSKESCLVYNYQFNSNDILKAQEIMLSLGITILNIIESLNNDLRILSFDILTLLYNRGEFDLNAMTFNNDDPNIKERTRIAENYLKFLNQSLEFVLERIANGKYSDKESKSFVEFFLSVAYFKIPKVYSYYNLSLEHAFSMPLDQVLMSSHPYHSIPRLT